MSIAHSDDILIEVDVMFAPIVRADELLERITSFYLKSSDFNRISICALSGIILDTDILRASLAALI